MIVTMTGSHNVKFGCSGTCHWYRDLYPGAVCICGKEKLKARKDYQPIQFDKVKTRKRRHK